ncbi:DnaB-like helicase N-terminal domain-containing protein [Streptomyces sp. ST2-7A]|uniref:DnaB-like helicase N-terminal domain-containing protein n=1 Tax=Streptomyces sp. ST2-7A TaxID=2907214 RepID=UPI001F33FC26|nr:DnaB-like helicase N-terminal domain-containing protein [Streptomyces sp. ST2-7A]MCE7080160.1 helicase DnaB [Streptomyces sp. ST2-7A]
MPLIRAEQAVLGAVLLEPRQLESLDGWLRPAHFHHHDHATLYEVLLNARAQQRPGALTAPGEPVPLEWVTDAVTRARRTAPGVTTARVFGFVSSCPHPRHAPLYGRMVLEGAIHRKVTEHATRLHQAALSDTANADHRDTGHHLGVLTGALKDLAKVWGTDPRPTPPPAELTARPATPPPTGPEQLADEEWLLACLTADPTGLDGIENWLVPEDFVEVDHQRIYRCLTALHHRGEPIDQLTVLWEAQRRGYLSDDAGPGLTGDRVLRVCAAGGVATSAAYHGRQQVRTAFVRNAGRAAGWIRHLATEHALPPGQLIGYSLHTLLPVEETFRRWRTAGGEPPGRPPTPPRVGPGAPGLPGSDLTAAARARSPRPHPDATGSSPETSAPPPSLTAPEHRSRRTAAP